MSGRLTSADSLCLVVEDHLPTSSAFKNVISKEYPSLRIVIKNNVSDARLWLRGRSENGDKGELVFALIDMGLPDGFGMDLLPILAELEPSCKNVMVTVFAEDRYLFNALAAGAFGYLLKGDDDDFLLDALKRVERDEPPMSPSIARRLISHFRNTPPHLSRQSSLTPREQQTLSLLVRGFTIPEAGKQLGLSGQTVAGYVKSIYHKLRVSNRAEATREAIRHGFV